MGLSGIELIICPGPSSLVLAAKIRCTPRRVNFSYVYEVRLYKPTSFNQGYIGSNSSPRALLRIQQLPSPSLKRRPTVIGKPTILYTAIIITFSIVVKPNQGLSRAFSTRFTLQRAGARRRIQSPTIICKIILSFLLPTSVPKQAG